jgi:hypothetical protein
MVVEVAAAIMPAYQVGLVVVEPIMVIKGRLVYRVVQVEMVTRRELEQTLAVVEAVQAVTEGMQMFQIVAAVKGAPALPLLLEVRRSS